MAEAEISPEVGDHSLSVIFVLGGPGSGKTTQCDRLCGQRGFTHVSVGDILHAEAMKEDSKWRSVIQDNVKSGNIDSIEMTVELLKENLMFLNTQKESNGRFVIDGRQVSTWRVESQV